MISEHITDHYPPGVMEARQTAFESCVAFYPALLLESARLRHPAQANRFAHLRGLDAGEALGLANPNPHVFYSSAWLDLDAGPVVISLPVLHGRHMTMALIDAWGELFASLGVRTLGDGPCDVAVAGPFWTGAVAPDMRVVRACTRRVWLLARTQCAEGEDETVSELLSRFYITPLRLKVREETASDSFPPGWRAPSGQNWRAEAVLDRIGRLLTDDPAPRELAGLIARLDRLGVSAERPFDISALPPLVADAVRDGVAEALSRIGTHAWEGEAQASGSWISSSWAGRGGDRLHRAAIAHRCLGLNATEDAAYFTAVHDREGEPLDGAYCYRLRFAPHSLPPAAAFWSLCAYDAQDRLIETAEGRAGLISRDPLRFERDGSLVLHVQGLKPRAAACSNWLAVRPGPFRLVFRAYWPGEALLAGEWRPPLIHRRDPGRRSLRRPSQAPSSLELVRVGGFGVPTGAMASL